MIVVSDASPLIALDAIGQLPLLRDLYGVVLIPPTVEAEIRAGLGGGPFLDSAPWIETRSVADGSVERPALDDLDAGEAEAITLALEQHADLLLMDERRGRSVAAELGLRRIGVVGVLLAAKRGGLTPAVGPLLDALVHRAGFWISSEVYRDAVATAGEPVDADGDQPSRS